jgi:hypothetical protein
MGGSKAVFIEPAVAGQTCHCFSLFFLFPVYKPLSKRQSQPAAQELIEQIKKAPIGAI